jgi:Uncharacterised protein family (UPF0164)
LLPLCQPWHPACECTHQMIRMGKKASGETMRVSNKVRGFEKFTISVFIIIALFATTAWGQVGNGSGTSSGEILNIGIGSRAASLGGAYMAFSDDATASFWNPSGLAGLSNVEFQFGYSSWYQDISINYLGAVVPMSENLSAGVGVVYVDYGEFTAYSEDDQLLGEFSGHNIMASISLAYKLNDRLSLGVTAKGVSEKLEESTAMGYAMDVGVRYNLGIFSVGMALKNVGSGLKYEYESAPLPTKLSAGIGLQTLDGQLRLAGDINVPKNGIISYHQGLEYLYQNSIYLRGGYSHSFSDLASSEKDGFVWGFGLKVMSGSIDYSYIPNGTFGAIHKIDLSIKLNR